MKNTEKKSHWNVAARSSFRSNSTTLRLLRFFYVCHTELTSSNLNWSKLKVLRTISLVAVTAIKMFWIAVMYRDWIEFHCCCFFLNIEFQIISIIICFWLSFLFFSSSSFFFDSWMYSFSPNGRTEPPRWACALCALGLFIYQSLDAIDGKQARRTNSSSPLGELFDHGCDSISTIFVALSACLSAQLGFYPKWMFFQVGNWK